MIFLTEQNTLKAYGTIWPGDGLEFVYNFEALAKQYDDVVVRMHTYGGSVFDGNLIYNTLNASQCKLIIDGIAASMGGILLTAVDDVSIVENGYIMLHAPSSAEEGTAQDHENAAKLLRAMEANFIQKLIARTGKSKKAVEKWLVGDNWFDSQEAKTIGLVRDVIPADIIPVIPIDDPNQLGELEVFNAYAKLLVPTASGVPNIENKENNNTEMKQLIITAFQLMAVTADSSDTAVLDALKSKFEAKETEATNAKADKKTAEDALTAYREEQVTGFVEAYAKENNLTDEKKSAYVTIGNTSGLEALMQVLNSTPNQQQPQAPGISSFLKKGGSASASAGREGWDWDKWQKEDPRGLERKAVEDVEGYNALFNAKYGK